MGRARAGYRGVQGSVLHTSQAKKTKADTTKQMKKMSSSPKSTLGDMDALQSLKDKLEGK